MPDLLDGLRPRVAPDDSPSRLLRALVDGVLAGSGQAVRIEGGPGSGRTELLGRALADARARGCRTAGSRARPAGPRVPLHPIMECLGLDPTSPDLRRVLNAVPPQLIPRSRTEGRAGDEVLVGRLLVMFTELCRQGPLVAAIDDLHLADPASLRFWDQLADRTRRLPLLLLAGTAPSLHPDPDVHPVIIRLP